jgi:hypothetical protein
MTKKRPWYEPSEKLPDEPVIAPNRQLEFESLVVEQPTERRPKAARGGVGTRTTTHHRMVLGSGRLGVTVG